MLSALQKHLCDIYQVDSGYDVSDFLVTDPTRTKGCVTRDSLLHMTFKLGQFCVNFLTLVDTFLFSFRLKKQIDNSLDMLFIIR